MLRKNTDKFLFGEDPSQRSWSQAFLRDISHGTYHWFGGVKNLVFGDKQRADQDFKRAADHFGGENQKQISQERRNLSTERRILAIKACNEWD